MSEAVHFKVIIRAELICLLKFNFTLEGDLTLVHSDIYSATRRKSSCFMEFFFAASPS